MNACVLIPIYNRRDEIRVVVESLFPHGLPCLIIDDGSDDATRAVLDQLAENFPWVEVHHCKESGGRGAALTTGYRLAAHRGFSHVIQIDADVQHDSADVPSFLASMRENPDALVLGNPIFDESIPKSRLIGRQFSRGLVSLLTLSLGIPDPFCGFRGVPLAGAHSVLDDLETRNPMEFDLEFVVRFYWAGLPIVSIPTRAAYDPEDLSYFDVVRDNLRLAGVVVRLFGGTLLRAPRLLAHRGSAIGTVAQPGFAWSQMVERGSIRALRVGAWLYRTFGRRGAYFFAYLTVAYLFSTDSSRRRTSLAYLDRIHRHEIGRRTVARRPGLRESFKHFLAFGLSITDRFGMWLGHTDFDFDVHGIEEFERLMAKGRGAVVIGSHLGSFDALRLLATKQQLVANIVMYTGHAAVINKMFEELDPKSRTRVIPIEQGSLRSTFEIRACLDRGELVTLLADRVEAGAPDRVLEALFLSDPVDFPTAPFELASVLSRPIVMMTALRTEEGRYEVFIETLSDGAHVPRRERAQHVEALMGRFVDQLEERCVRSPYQWFNFFDYWGDET